MPVTLRGYSERGMVNALCNDICREWDGNTEMEVLKAFLDLCEFPLLGDKPDFSGLKEATLIVEQSFSDFGDLDLLILLDYRDGRKRAVLAEAKVATDTGNPVTIQDQWDDFHAYLAGDSD
jgi:hypothetical protein